MLRHRPAVRARRRGRLAAVVPGVLPRRGGRPGDRRGAHRAGDAERQAAGRDPPAAGRAARDLPAVAATPRCTRAAPWTRRRCSRSGTGSRTRRSATRTWSVSAASTADRRRVASPAPCATPVPSPGPRSSSCTWRPGGLGGPAGPLAHRVHPGDARAGPERAGDVPACTPTGPPSPAGTGRGWSSRASSRSPSAARRTTCRWRARSR